jgi:hypothetical protein
MNCKEEFHGDENTSDDISLNLNVKAITKFLHPPEKVNCFEFSIMEYCHSSYKKIILLDFPHFPAVHYSLVVKSYNTTILLINSNLDVNNSTQHFDVPDNINLYSHSLILQTPDTITLKSSHHIIFYEDEGNFRVKDIYPHSTFPLHFLLFPTRFLVLRMTHAKDMNVGVKIRNEFSDIELISKYFFAKDNEKDEKILIIDFRYKAYDYISNMDVYLSLDEKSKTLNFSRITSPSLILYIDDPNNEKIPNLTMLKQIYYMPFVIIDEISSALFS